MQLAGGYEGTPSTNFEAHKLRPHLAKQKEKLAGNHALMIGRQNTNPIHP